VGISFFWYSYIICLWVLLTSHKKMNPTYVVNQIATTTSDIGTALSGALPYVLAILAALIGLGVAVRYVKRWIGRK